MADLKRLLREEAPRLCAEFGVQGASLALIESSRPSVTVVAGVQNAQSRAPVTEASVFEAYSLSKPPTAYLTLQLAVAGVIDLDRPIVEYHGLDTLHADPMKSKITARMILNHTSGLPDEGRRDEELPFAPGTKWRYSTEAYCLLGEILEVVTGSRLGDLMGSIVLSPMDMRDSSWIWDDRFETRVALGHGQGSIPQPERRITAADADSLLTTGSDYAKFLATCLRGSSTDHQSQLSLRSMVESSVQVQSGVSWSLGWGLADSEEDRILWHIGGGAGASFQNLVMARPEQGLGLVLLTNSANGAQLFGPISEMVFGRTPAVLGFISERFY